MPLLAAFLVNSANQAGIAVRLDKRLEVGRVGLPGLAEVTGDEHRTELR